MKLFRCFTGGWDVAHAHNAVLRKGALTDFDLNYGIKYLSLVATQESIVEAFMLK